MTNTGDKEQPLGGWILKRTADNQVIEYKFGKSIVLKPGQSLNVHSANAGVTQDVAAGELVMGGGQKWPVGDAIITVLLDKEGNVRVCLYLGLDRGVVIDRFLVGTIETGESAGGDRKETAHNSDSVGVGGRGQVGAGFVFAKTFQFLVKELRVDRRFIFSPFRNYIFRLGKKINKQLFSVLNLNLHFSSLK